MADDVDLLIGSWSVNCGRWRWEYSFQRTSSFDGSVRWYDRNSKDGGSGRWAKSWENDEDVIQFSWDGSGTREYWKRPITSKGTRGHVSASYGEFETTADKIPNPEDDVRTFYESEAITFTNTHGEAGFKQALNHQKVGGSIARHSAPLLRAIAALTSVAGKLQILRTFAPDQGPHGTNGVCEAVDVAIFGSYTFEWHTPKALLIDGVKKLILAMPNDISFDLGVVRPVGGIGGFNTTFDVFFRVAAENVVDPKALRKDPKTGRLAPGQAPNAVSPGAGWGLTSLLPDARAAIDLARKGQKLGYIYPDGADHVHIKAF